ncbi:MAG: DNA topoisomerase IB [Alphaproteobacteria bacterium]|jgi:DNA topoisomerase-1|nr:DNA topoisomerase IB [Alphaproteobacteria bacterium]
MGAIAHVTAETPQARTRERRALALTIRAAGLVRIEPEALTISRHRTPTGFFYTDAEGRRISDPAVLDRIRLLAIPPAYEDVRIADDPRAHIQALGRDEAGRLQHRYHTDWERVREVRKGSRLARLAEALPRLRAAVARDIAARALSREKAIACAVALIDETHIRVGCEAYARQDGGRGAATLLKRNVRLQGSRIELEFRGKGGKNIVCGLDSPTLARAFARLMKLPGPRLFQYRQAGGPPLPITAADINAYLRQATGAKVSAKDLRTLAASVAAAEQLLEIEPAASEAERRRQLASVMRSVSEELINTPAVARRSYVHAVIVEAFETGALQRMHDKARGGRYLRRIEKTVGLLVRSRRRR